METGLEICVFFWIYTTLFVNPSFTEESVCSLKRSHKVKGEDIYYNETVCCDNYEMIANTCIACNIGFVRPGDKVLEKCIPCEEGFFGPKCAYPCNCGKNERCNRSTGCFLEHVANDERTTFFSTSSAQQEYNDVGRSGMSANETTLHPNNSTTPTDRKSVTMTHDAVSAISQDRTKHDYIMVYIAFTGGLALLITVAVACRRRLPMVDKSKMLTKKRRQRPMQNEQERNNMINVHENGNVYDIIEEQNMI